MKTVVALYDDFEDAQSVARELVNSGIDRERINLIAGDREGHYSSRLGSGESADDSHSGVAGGATAGAIAGGVGGALLGLGALAIPGIGPVVAAGPLVSALIGGGVGAAVGGLVGGLIDAGIPEEHANYYAEGIRQGGTLVTAEVDEMYIDRVVGIMDRYNPIDIEQRAVSWRQSGWTGFEADNDTTTVQSSPSTRYAEYATESTPSRARTTATSGSYSDDDTDTTIEVVEEDLRVGKRQVEGGGVRVQTHVVEEPVEEQVRLREERVQVERRPVNRPASDADLDAFKERSFEVNAVREEAVVDKQARVVEEVSVRKDAQERVETVRDTVRRTEVDVQQMESDLRTYDTDFRSHYQTTFGRSGGSYEQYEPAYRYGYTIANDTRYQGRDWNAVESDLRSDWSRQHNDSAWDDVKDAVRHGWQRVRQSMR